MPFADAQALILVRDALWKRPRRGACVMVGAGLSKNQGPPHSGAAPPPTWSELAQSLSERLSVPSAAGPLVDPKASSHTCPALAQQFEAHFTRGALDNFLLNRIPDNRKPHAIHSNLLRLPWADVFTTNWDTLLERASNTLRDAVYHPVYTSSDLSASDTPRIVKLHGSFPSHRPFIITEEDYRKYPQSHAPFVNTVQQALMERVVLLLGFSGDDQNFLHWLGWVRDHMGAAAPPLFLGGFLDLSRPRRRLLEDRGVIPIDLANHPKVDSWYPHRHRRAIEWILCGLARGEPYSRHWPTPRPAKKRVNSLLEPTLFVHSISPKTESSEVPTDSGSEKRQASVTDVLHSWTHNRSCYPEWVVLPFSRVGQLAHNTDLWNDLVISCAATWTPVKRLNAIYELAWRHDLLMFPYDSDLIDSIEKTIGTIDDDVLSQYSGSVSDRADIIELRAALLLSLLTEARFSFQSTRFFEATELLKKYWPTSTNAKNRFRHEEGLWLLTVQDFDLLAKRMKSWDVQDFDPIWALRKAALLADLGQYTTATDLAQWALYQLERDTSSNTNVRTMSRLSWALHWQMCTETAKWWESRLSGQPDHPPIFDKWSRFSQYNCDAYSEWKQFEGAVKSVRSPTPSGSLFPRPHTIQELRPDEYERYRYARRAVRLIELTGLPSRIRGVNMAASVLEKSALAMSDLGVRHSLPIAIRAGSSHPNILSAVVSSGHVARLDSESATQVVQSLEKGRDHHLNQPPEKSMDDAVLTKKVSANVEALAWCVPRAGNEKAEELFRWALAYGNRKRARRHRSLWRSVQRLWRESWLAMTPQRRQEMMVEVLSSSTLEHLPLQDYGDPAEVALYADIPVGPDRGNNRAWSNCAGSVAEALRLGGEARRRAAIRLLAMVIRRVVPSTARVELGQALWRGTALDGSDMPDEITLADWKVLDLPEPEAGAADLCFRRKWIQRDINDGPNATLEATLAEVCNAWRTDLPWHRAIALSPEEQDWLWNFVHRWLSTRDRSRFGMDNPDPREIELIDGLAAIVSRREVPQHIVSALYGKIEKLKIPRQMLMSDSFHGNEYRLIAAAAGLRTEESRRAEMLVRMGILSDEERVRESALDGLHWWLVEIEKPSVSIRAPSLSCVLDIGMTLGSQREGGIKGAVKGVIAVLNGSSEEYRKAVVPLAKEGLCRWWPVLQYGRADVGGTDWDKTVVQRRVWCVRLARAMERSGHGDPDIVRKWLDAAKKDPMASVRYAAEE